MIENNVIMFDVLFSRTIFPSSSALISPVNGSVLFSITLWHWLSWPEGTELANLSGLHVRGPADDLL